MPAAVGVKVVVAPVALDSAADGDHAKLLSEPEAPSDAVKVKLCAP